MKDLPEKLAAVVPSLAGTGASWSLTDTSVLAAIIVAVVTTLYTIAMLAFLMRKWYLLENGGWKKKVPTDFGALSEPEVKEMK